MHTLLNNKKEKESISDKMLIAGRTMLEITLDK
jgi:hypothetical protein